MNKEAIPEERFLQKNIFIWGLVAYLSLLAMAVWFYKERAVFLDMAFHIVNITQKKTFFIMSERFGAFFTQAFVLVSSWLHLPLKLLMVAYSASFIILYGGVFLYNVYQKAYKPALLMLFFSILMVNDTFYWAQSELPQAMAWMILLLGLWYRKPDPASSSWIKAGLSFFILWMVLMSHPVMFLVLVFVFLYFIYVEKESYNSVVMKTGLFFTVLFYVTRTYIIGIRGYDTSGVEKTKNIARFFPHYLDLPTNWMFLKHIPGDYAFLFIALGLNIFFLVKKKTWLGLGLMLGFFAGYLFLTNVSYFENVEQFYIENLYLPLTIFVAIPFLWKVMPSINPGYFSIALVLLVCIRIGDIYQTHRLYTDRLNWWTIQIDKARSLPGCKFYIDPAEAPKELLLMNWGSAWESLVLSSIKYPERPMTMIIADDMERVRENAWLKDQFIGAFKIQPLAGLDQYYFPIRDTAGYVQYHISQ